MTDADVAAYLGLTTDQVRVIRQTKDIHACSECSAIHPTLPVVRFFHSPICKTGGKCRICGGTLLTGRGGAIRGGEVGLICRGCYEADEDSMEAMA